jgi:hypothetical protein
MKKMVDIDEKDGRLVDANTQRSLWLEGEIFLLSINCNKSHPYFILSLD